MFVESMGLSIPPPAASSPRIATSRHSVVLISDPRTGWGRKGPYTGDPLAHESAAKFSGSRLRRG